MDRRRSDQGWRAVALAMALIAISLNFLQPLAHAALMRSGAPANWAAICLPGAQQDDKHPASAGQPHECCLGLAHGPGLADPPTDFVAAERPTTVTWAAATTQALTPVGIRDGPSQPRAPPFPT